jgi:hypothetical protein
MASGVTPTQDRHGSPNSAYTFDGSSAFVEYNGGSLNLLNIGSSSWTVSAWVNTAGVGSGYQTVVSRYECGWSCPHGGATDAAWYNLYLLDNRPVFTIRTDQDIAYDVAESAALTVNTWHLLTGVLDQSAHSVSLYVDGVSVASVFLPVGQSITDSGSPLEIGRLFRQGWAAPTSYFSGAIDDVRIYSDALDSSAIEALYTGAANHVPEPSVGALLGIAAGALMALRRRSQGTGTR